ncbi:MAG: hypothetical protein GY855_11800 [candidate division Zixibacteria bacterium]|nr:hypothetical protein [candidate division Zixibacteria bacterium]
MTYFWCCPRLPSGFQDGSVLQSNDTIQSFHEGLIEWYQENHRKLPCRETNDPYRIWVSEVMLQQTQVNTVIPYFHRFIERFPNLQKLVAADQQDVLKIWECLGYYSRARSLHRAAKTMITQCHGGLLDGKVILFYKSKVWYKKMTVQPSHFIKKK